MILWYYEKEQQHVTRVYKTVVIERFDLILKRIDRLKEQDWAQSKIQSDVFEEFRL